MSAEHGSPRSKITGHLSMAAIPGYRDRMSKQQGDRSAPLQHGYFEFFSTSKQRRIIVPLDPRLYPIAIDYR